MESPPGRSAPLIDCPNCGHPNPTWFSKCDHCRAALPSTARTRSMVIRTRLTRWGLPLAILLIAASWFAYVNLGTARFMGPPASDISSLSAPGDWAMFQRDAGHSGFAPRDTFIPEGTVRWRFETSAPILSSPTVEGNRVYLSTGDRRVVSLDANTGELIWEYPVTGPVNSSVAIAGDMAFVGLRDGRVLALDKEGGRLLWQFDTGNPVFASPTVYKGVLYITSGSKRLFTIDALTGEERWNYDVADWIITSPAVNDQVTAFVGSDRNLHIVGANTARSHLLYALGAYSDTSAVLYEDRLFVTDSSGKLRALDWSKQEISFERFVRRVKSQFFIWGLQGTPPIPKGFVWVFNEGQGDALSGPAVGHDRVYVGSASGQFYALDMESGEIVWQFEAEAPIGAVPSVNSRAVFMGDENGNLYYLDLDTGMLLGRMEVGSAIASTPVLANGSLYLPTASGVLYSIQ